MQKRIWIKSADEEDFYLLDIEEVEFYRKIDEEFREEQEIDEWSSPLLAYMWPIMLFLLLLWFVILYFISRL